MVALRVATTAVVWVSTMVVLMAKSLVASLAALRAGRMVLRMAHTTAKSMTAGTMVEKSVKM